jgi:uncharacterized protein (TIGR00251 family)
MKKSPADQEIGTQIRVKVIPGAKKNEIAEVMEDGRLRVRLTAPPVEGRANQALIKLLAKMFGLPKSSINIVSGERNRNKRLHLGGLDRQDYQRIIEQILD